MSLEGGHFGNWGKCEWLSGINDVSVDILRMSNSMINLKLII